MADTEALKALVAFVKADKRINGDVALTECRKALPALERMLASQGEPYGYLYENASGIKIFVEAAEFSTSLDAQYGEAEFYCTRLYSAPAAGMDILAVANEIDNMLTKRGLDGYSVRNEIAAIIRKHLRPTQQTEGASAAPQAEGEK